MARRRKLIKYLILFLIFTAKIYAQETALESTQEKETNAELPQDLPKPKTSFFNSPNFTFNEKYIFSLDTSYLLSGLKNNGWGLGVSYEALAFPFLSAKGEFSHSTVWSKNYDATIKTVGISGNVFFYPFDKGLNFLYFGGGCRTDFLMYDGGDVPSDHKKDTLIRVFPQIGWKQNLFDWLLIDVYYSYRFSFDSSSELPEFVGDITNHGSGFGVKLKFNLSKLWKTIRRK